MGVSARGDTATSESELASVPAKAFRKKEESRVWNPANFLALLLPPLNFVSDLGPHRLRRPKVSVGILSGHEEVPDGRVSTRDAGGGSTGYEYVVGRLFLSGAVAASIEAALAALVAWTAAALMPRSAAELDC